MPNTFGNSKEEMVQSNIEPNGSSANANSFNFVGMKLYCLKCGWGKAYDERTFVCPICLSSNFGQTK